LDFAQPFSLNEEAKQYLRSQIQFVPDSGLGNMLRLFAEFKPAPRRLNPLVGFVLPQRKVVAASL
jgi:hypothetical protein